MTPGASIRRGWTTDVERGEAYFSANGERSQRRNAHERQRALKKVVIHGIVETMNDRQLEERTQSLHDAVQRLSAARSRRGGELTSIDAFADVDEAVPMATEPDRPRRRLFSFAARARAAGSPPTTEE